MIWILLGYLLFGGTSAANLVTTLEGVRDRVVEALGDDARAGAATAAIEARIDRIEEERERFTQTQDEFLMLLRDRTSPRSAFDTHFEAADALRFGVQNELLDLREELRELMRGEEWSRVFPVHDLPQD